MGKEARKPFALLRPVRSPQPRIPLDWVVAREPTAGEVRELARELSAARLVAIDFETKGTRPWVESDCVVGLAIAWVRPDGERAALYFDWPSVSLLRRRSIWDVLSAIPATTHILAHNVYFDSGWAWAQAVRDFGYSTAEAPRHTEWPIRWTHCTYGLYRALASEGWTGQEWGLKAAMEDCLGWTETNEVERDEWLLSRGYHKVGPRYLVTQPREAPAPEVEEGEPEGEEDDEAPTNVVRGRRVKWAPRGESPAEHRERVRQWEAVDPERRAGKVRPNLGEMWRVPPAILGRYACLDAIATLDLFALVLEPVLRRFPEFASFHSTAWMQSCLLLAEQTFVGIRVLLPVFLSRIEQLERAVAEADAACRSAPQLGEVIGAIEAKRLERLIAELRAKEPPKFNKGAVPEEPKKKTKKDGSPTTTWLKWRERMDHIEKHGLEPSTRWVKWAARLEAAPTKVKPWSAGSPDQLREALFHPVLGSPLVRISEYEEDPDTYFVVHGVNGAVPITRTDAGLLSCDASLLSQLPSDFGGPLTDHADASTELSIARSYLTHFHFHPDPNGPDLERPDDAESRRGTWRLHPGWKVPGTKTGRLGGKDPNLQAVPKALEFLDAFVPDEGYVWVEADAAALEPHVLAELSRDEGLLALYGPGSNPNQDRYLFTVARIPNALFDPVREHYDWRNPTAEGVAAAKSHCKKLRELAKILVLSGDYGAGALKKWIACLLKGIKISFEEMVEVHRAQVEAAPGVAAFRASLEDEWRRRGGWILSPHGFPTPVHEDYTRDLVNRCVQRGGHECHTLLIWILESLLTDAGIQVRGIIWDLHDQFVIQVAEADGPQTLALVQQANDELNRLLGGVVSLKYGPRLVRSLSEAKMGEDFDKREMERELSAGDDDAA